MLIVFGMFTIYYVLFVSYFIIGQYRFLKNNEPIPSESFAEDLPAISVVLPFHNEEQTLPVFFSLMDKQNYPAELVELILVDDESTDHSPLKAKNYAAFSKYLVKVVSSFRQEGKAPKKTAISLGIRKASSELIVLTDADVSGGENWLRSLAAVFIKENSDMIIAPVAIDYESDPHPFYRVQALDFAGLIACGAGAAGWGKPFLCNGANLAVRKSAFESISGYAGYETILSGDDVFLLEKMRTNRRKISFCWHDEALIYTSPKKDLKSFMLQRSRWASKNHKYDSTALVISLLLIYLYFWVLPAAMLWLPLNVWLPALGIKILFDLLLTVPLLKRLMPGNDLARTVISAELFQLFYIPIVGIMALLRKTDW